MSELGNFDALKPTILYDDDDELKSLTHVQLHRLLERNQKLLENIGPNLPDKGEKIRLKMASIETEKQHRMFSRQAKSHEHMPDDDGSVPDSQEGHEEYSEQLVLKDLANFKERLSDARLFILDTRTLKDQIRATIRCFKILVSKFDLALSQLCGVGQGGLGLTHGVTQPPSDDSEQLSCDQLRLIAYKLFKFFRDETLNSFVTAVSLDAVEARQVVGATVIDGDSLVYRVMYQGYDCRNFSEDEYDSDDDKLTSNGWCMK